MLPRINGAVAGVLEIPEIVAVAGQNITQPDAGAMTRSFFFAMKSSRFARQTTSIAIRSTERRILWPQTSSTWTIFTGTG
ncbi:MAG: hypothetical protein AAGF50_11845 [Pseudomonadota bacterium]